VRILHFCVRTMALRRRKKHHAAASGLCLDAGFQSTAFVRTQGLFAANPIAAESSSECASNVMICRWLPLAHSLTHIHPTACIPCRVCIRIRAPCARSSSNIQQYRLSVRWRNSNICAYLHAKVCRTPARRCGNNAFAFVCVRMSI
jgi:hypothetical protein